MDNSLWNSTYQDTLEDSKLMQYGQNFDMLYGHSYDIIEENAMNESSCIEVLNRLIAKANTDIEELEQNLVSLQTELACVEDEEWSEICCSALREKINGLEVTLRRSKNQSANATQLQLSMPRKPAEKIQDILKDLLRKHYLEKNTQPPEVVALDLKSDSAEGETEHFERLVRRKVDSDITAKESGESITPVERCPISNSSPDHLETDYPKAIKPAPKDTVDPGPDLILVADSSDEKKMVTEAPGPDLILVADSSDEEKKLVNSDSSEITRPLEAMGQEPTSMDGKTKESESSKDEERESLEPAAVTPAASILRSVKFSKECVNVVKSLCKSDMKANQITEVTMAAASKQDSTAVNDLDPEADRTHERIDEPQNGIVEHTILHASTERAAVNVSNPISQSKSSTSRTTEVGDGDLDEKIAELKRKTTRKEGIREPKIGTVKTSNSIAAHKPKSDVARKLQFLIAERQLQLDSQRLFKEAEWAAGKPEVHESPKTVGFKTSHLNFDQKPQVPKAKRKPQSESESMKVQVVSPTKRKHITSSLSTQKLHKPDADEDTACLNEVIVKNPKKLVVLPEPLPKEHGASLAARENPLVHSQGSKSVTDLPVGVKKNELTVDLKFPDPRRHASNGGAAGKNPNSPAPIPSRYDGSQDLLHMKVLELRAVAKELKIAGCSKLKKQDLIDRINAKQQEKSQI